MKYILWIAVAFIVGSLLGWVLQNTLEAGVWIIPVCIVVPFVARQLMHRRKRRMES